MLYHRKDKKYEVNSRKMVLVLEALIIMKNGKNRDRWIRITAVIAVTLLLFIGTATTSAYPVDSAKTDTVDAIHTPFHTVYSATLPTLSVMTTDRSMKLVEEALEKMEASKDTGKNENNGGKENNKPSSTGKEETANTGNTTTSSEPSSSVSSSKPTTSKPSSNDTTALKNNGCEIDTSKASSGTIQVRQNGCSTKVKVLVYFNGSSQYYQYTIPTDNTWTSIPLQSGSGTYKVRFMKQVNGTSYSQMYSVTFQVGMQNANSAYLNPSQYVVYTSGSACVAKAKSLVAGVGSDAQKVSRIYSYIVNNISYDYDKMNSVSSGYLPNPDSTLSSRKGICFDYAALMAAMLRSQGVPCKLVIGNADSAYHAWNMVYVNGSWQLYDATYGAADQRASSYVAQRVY